MATSSTFSSTFSDTQPVLFGWAAPCLPVRWAYGPADVPPYDPSRRAVSFADSLEVGEVVVKENWGKVRPAIKKPKPPTAGSKVSARPYEPYPRLVRADVAGQGADRLVSGSKLIDDLDNAGVYLVSSRAKADTKFMDAVLKLAHTYSPVLSVYGGEWGVGWGETSLQRWRELVVRVRLYLEVLQYLEDKRFSSLEGWLIDRREEFLEDGFEWECWRFFLDPLRMQGREIESPKQYKAELARNLFTFAGISTIHFHAQTAQDGTLEPRLNMHAGVEQWAFYELAKIFAGSNGKKVQVGVCYGCGKPMLAGRGGKRSHTNAACKQSAKRKKAAREALEGIPMSTPEPKHPKKARGS